MLKVYVSVHILSRILCAFGPEANAVWGVLAWKSLGTTGAADNINLTILLVFQRIIFFFFSWSMRTQNIWDGVMKY